MESIAPITAAHGWSGLPNAHAALDEIFEDPDLGNASLGIVFASSDYDLDALGKAAASRFSCPVVGCSTAGEISRLGYSQTGVAAAAIYGIDARVETIDNLHSFDAERASALADTLGVGDLSHDEHAVMLTLFDGLCMREESLCSQIYVASGGVPMVGGSSGDSLTFNDTSILVGDRFQKDIGVCALLRARGGVHTFIGHHYKDTGQILVVTKADPENRVIYELNGMPAAEAYARALGFEPGRLSKVDELLNPLMVRTGERFYVRGVQQLRDDGSMRLYCAIDEGVVLHLGHSSNIHERLATQLEHACMGVDPQLVLMFDCITRRLEADHMHSRDQFARVVSNYPAIGFSTYGEHYNGVHVNQTMTGIVFGG